MKIGHGKISVLTLGFLFAPLRHAIAVDLTSCGILKTAGMSYVLQNDVTSDGTCFSIQADNIQLDLNGHAVTYGNGPVITVPNGSFESGTAGWDFSQAPNAEVIAGSYADPVQVSEGNHAVAVTMPASGQFIKTNAPITLPAGRIYFISGMFYYMDKVSAKASMEVDDAVSGVMIATASFTGPTNRGFKYFHAEVSPAVDTAIVIKIFFEGTAGTIYFDDVRATICPSHGIVSQAYYSLGRYDNPYGGSARNFVVKHGIIKQGAGNGYGSSAIRFNEVYLLDKFEVYDTTMTVYGPGSKNIDVFECQGDVIAHDNVLYNNVTVISSRDQKEGALISVGGGGAGSAIVYNNKLVGGAQIGITLGGNAGNQIYNNDISQNARYGNDDAIDLYGCKNSDIHHNYIHPISGRGIMDSIGENNKIHDNIVESKELDQIQEYGCKGGDGGYASYGIELRSDHNGEVYNNSFTSYADVCPAQGIGLRIDPGLHMVGEKVYNNTVRAIRVGTTKQKASNVNWINVDGGVVLSNNIFTSDGPNVWDYWGGGLNTFFSSCTFVKGTNPASDYHTFAYVTGGTSTGTIILDGTFLNGASSTDVYIIYPIGYFGWSSPVDLFIDWTLDLTVVDNKGNPVPNTNITISDKTNQTVFTGLTDSLGMAHPTLTQYHILNTTTIAVQIDTFTPHVILAVKDGLTASATLTMDAKKSLTLVLGDSAPIILKQPANQTVNVAEKGSFSIDAAGTLPLTYLWQISKDKGVSWSDTGAPSSPDYVTPITTPADNGTQFRCVVKNTLGNLISAAATLTVNSADTTPPTVSFTSPFKGETVSGVVNVSVNTTDNTGVTKVEFYVDGSLKESVPAPFNWLWNTITISNDIHSLAAEAYDAANNVGTSATLFVKVANPVAGSPTGDSSMNSSCHAEPRVWTAEQSGVIHFVDCGNASSWKIYNSQGLVGHINGSFANMANLNWASGVYQAISDGPGKQRAKFEVVK